MEKRSLPVKRFHYIPANREAHHARISSCNSGGCSFIKTVSHTEERDRSEVNREITNFSNYLKKCGLKITNQRLLVAEKIFGLKSHFTVDSLAESLREHKSEISRATIYRIVSLIVESGQLIEHNFGHNVRYYEHIPRKEHHDHMVCTDCGRIDEFMDDEIENLQLMIAERLGYELRDHSLNLYGKCKELAEKGACERAQKPAQN